jgi:signal recognition particle receptor subunit alpha
VFVVAFQKILQLSYIDKFLSDIQREFRDKYKNELTSQGREFQNFDFSEEFNRLLKAAENSARKQATIPQKMKTFEESHKSKKTVSSMIERKGGDTTQVPAKKTVKIVEAQKESDDDDDDVNGNSDNVIMENRKKLMEKMSGKKHQNLQLKTRKKAKKQEFGN